MADGNLTLSAEIVGADKIKTAFSQFPNVAARAIANALNQTANDIKEDAKNLAPHLHGYLMDSIHTEEAQATAGIEMEARVGTTKNIPYAKAQEYGTVGMEIHSHSRLGKVFTYIGNIKGKHYMKQARDNAKVKLTQHLQVALQRITKAMAVSEI